MSFREELQKEAIETALKNNSGTIVLPMRTGKTFCGLSIASNFDKVLVSYPNKSIYNSWIEDSKKFNIDISNITFTTHISLPKHNLSEYDVVLLDEIDQVSENTWQHIASSFIKRIYGLTGTPANRGDKLTYMNNYCPIIYKRTIDETTGKTNKDYEIIVHLINPSTEKNIALKSGRFWSDSQKIAFFESKYNQSRNFKDMLMLIQSIQNSPTKLKYLKQLSNKIDRGLIFVETAKQCDELGYPSFHSKNNSSEDNLVAFKNGEINKLSTISQLKAGVTFENLNTCIILHCYSSNNRSAQKIGRCLNYVENEKATIHVIGLNNTRDVQWIKAGLQEFNQEKIKYVKV